MRVEDLQKLEKLPDLMPVLFIGHGSPMNGIEENDFTAGWQKSVSNQERRCQEQERTLF